MSDFLTQAWWPINMLGDALDAIAASHGLKPNSDGEVVSGDWPPVTPERLDRWIAWAGEQIGVEALPVSARIRELSAFLANGGPAILRVHDQGRDGFLALIGYRWGRPRFLTFGLLPGM